MERHFTLDDLYNHISLFMKEFQKNSSDERIEDMLINYADYLDRMHPYMKRESMIDAVFENISIEQSVSDWIDSDTSTILTENGLNGFIKADICAIHTEYSDWCMREEIDDNDVVDYLELYKMLRSLKYKVHFY